MWQKVRDTHRGTEPSENFWKETKCRQNVPADVALKQDAKPLQLHTRSLLLHEHCVFSVTVVCLLQVCKRMDMICQRVLNQGFLKVERYHSLCQRQVKAQLPR